MATLVELFKAGGLAKYDTDKGAGAPHHHNYLGTYDKLFAPYKDEDIHILEVGYLFGASCKLWEDYFTKAHITAIEKGDNPVLLPELKRTKIVEADMNLVTTDFLLTLSGGPLTIAIDDGSHKLVDQVHFVKTVFPVLKPGGLLVIEDIQNIDEAYPEFMKLGIPFEVIDLRGRYPLARYDDVLLVFRKLE
jgi:demethylmacrocin O-methyltransferase